jgi:hypothetical protein
VDLNNKKGFHCITISLYHVQVALGVHCFIALNSQVLEAMRFKATSFSVFGS